MYVFTKKLKTKKTFPGIHGNNCIIILAGGHGGDYDNCGKYVNILNDDEDEKDNVDVDEHEDEEEGEDDDDDLAVMVLNRSCPAVSQI